MQVPDTGVPNLYTLLGQVIILISTMFSGWMAVRAKREVQVTKDEVKSNREENNIGRQHRDLKLDEIHYMVNDRLTVALNEIGTLKAEVARLKLESKKRRG